MVGQLLKKLFIAPIRLYQVALSPLLGSNCRFQPTCSQYMVDAIQEWGVLKGVWLGLRRIGRCHPWGPAWKYDPVPKKKSEGGSRKSEATRINQDVKKD